MEPTATGPNRTGIAQAVKQVQLMLEAVDELSPADADQHTANRYRAADVHHGS